MSVLSTATLTMHNVVKITTSRREYTGASGDFSIVSVTFTNDTGEEVAVDAFVAPDFPGVDQEKQP